MKPKLVILAAGMGSRYGGLKQIDSFGPNGETIIEYSIFEAINAGFDHIIFVIRKAFHDAFSQKFEPIFEGKVKVSYAFQEIDSPVEGIDDLPKREKPWGTAHAVMVAEQLVDTPFAVINADDYYGRSAFRDMATFLTRDCTPILWAMAGYVLGKTLSDHGMVNRGIAQTDDNNHLVDIHERLKIQKENGQITYLEGDERHPLAETDLASMNFFGFHPSIFGFMKAEFKNFVEENRENPKAEFYIPYIVNLLIQRGEIQMAVIPSEDQWYGVTYPDDKPKVQAAFEKMIDTAYYPKNLWHE
ncbi:MAG: sugar phosphate nucleotidyltransferase [Bacteroidota bacterium]